MAYKNKKQREKDMADFFISDFTNNTKKNNSVKNSDHKYP
jgi:hypothetical protein